jgi:hypothetical protein
MLAPYKELIEANPLSIATLTNNNTPNIIIVAEARVISNIYIYLNYG